MPSGPLQILENKEKQTLSNPVRHKIMRSLPDSQHSNTPARRMICRKDFALLWTHIFRMLCAKISGLFPGLCGLFSGSDVKFAKALSLFVRFQS